MSPWFVLGAFALGAFVGFVAGAAAGVASAHQQPTSDEDRGWITRDEAEEMVARRLHPTSKPNFWN